jgi:transcription regulator MmyB-like protein
MSRLVPARQPSMRSARYPVIGDITLDFDAMELPAHPGLTAYSAESGTPAHDSLSLLASWAATDHKHSPQQQDTRS